MIITILPRSKLRLVDLAEVAKAAGQTLWQNGSAVVACAVRPGDKWHPIPISMKGNA